MPHVRAVELSWGGRLGSGGYGGALGGCAERRIDLGLGVFGGSFGFVVADVVFLALTI